MVKETHNILKGFTLVEMLVVVLILGALAAIALPRIMGSSTTAKVNACKTNVGLLNSQIELYCQNEGDWPLNFNELTKDPNYFPDGPPECPFGNPYPINGLTHRIIEHNH